MNQERNENDDDAAAKYVPCAYTYAYACNDDTSCTILFPKLIVQLYHLSSTMARDSRHHQESRIKNR